MRVHASALSLTVALLGAASASAQVEFVPAGDVPEGAVGSDGSDPSYGTAADIVVTFFAHDFNLVVGTEGPGGTGYTRTCSSTAGPRTRSRGTRSGACATRK